VTIVNIVTVATKVLYPEEVSFIHPVFGAVVKSGPRLGHTITSIHSGRCGICSGAVTLACGVSAIRATWQLGAQCNGEAKVSIERNGPNGTFAGEEQSVGRVGRTNRAQATT